MMLSLLCYNVVVSFYESWVDCQILQRRLDSTICFFHQIHMTLYPICFFHYLFFDAFIKLKIGCANLHDNVPHESTLCFASWPNTFCASNVFTLWMHFKLALCIAQYLSNPSLIVNSCSIKPCNIYPTILHAFKTEFYMIIELEE